MLARACANIFISTQTHNYSLQHTQKITHVRVHCPHVGQLSTSAVHFCTSLLKIGVELFTERACFSKGARMSILVRVACDDVSTLHVTQIVLMTHWAVRCSRPHSGTRRSVWPFTCRFLHQFWLRRGSLGRVGAWRCSWRRHWPSQRDSGGRLCILRLFGRRSPRSPVHVVQRMIYQRRACCKRKQLSNRQTAGSVEELFQHSHGGARTICGSQNNLR